MTHKPIISILIPTFNSASDIAKCLKCLENQSLKRFNVVVVDDNSVDSTIKIAEKFKGKINLKIIVKDKSIKSGAASSINYFFEKTRTKFIALIDADALLAKNWVETMILELQKADVVGAPILAYRKGNLISQFSGYEIESRYRKISEGIINHLSTCNLAGRKEIFSKIELNTKLKYAYDHELSYLLIRKRAKIVLTNKTFCYHKNKSSLIGYIVQQYNIAKYHTLLACSMTSEALKKDKISPQVFALQPIVLLLSIIFIFINNKIALLFLVIFFSLNYYFLLFLLTKRKYFILFVSLPILLIRGFCWILGVMVGVFVYIIRLQSK